MIRSRLLSAVAVAAIGVGVLSEGASAHGGAIAIEVSGSASGPTVTYNVHLIWEDGHDVIGQGVVITATGPGGTKSATLPATNSGGRTSGSITLGDGTWAVRFDTDGGTRTISEKIGADPVTAPPATPAPPVAPAPTPAPTAAPVPALAAPPTTKRLGAATATTRPGATTPTTIAAPSDTTPTTLAAAADTTAPPESAATLESTTTTPAALSTTSSTTTSTVEITEIALTSGEGDDAGGGSRGWIVGLAIAVPIAAGVGVALRRRQSASATS